MGDLVTNFAGELRAYAGHFELRDWNYTRDTKPLHAIYYNYPDERLLGRIKRAARYLFERTPAWARGWSPNRFAMAAHVLHRDRHLPDGMLDGGCILTQWEETGEYLQYVQPSVGLMLADWMDAEPDNPHAIRIATEMKRINDAYGERIKEMHGDR